MGALDIKLNGAHTGVTSRSLNLVEGQSIQLTPTGADTIQIDFDEAQAPTFTSGIYVDGDVIEFNQPSATDWDISSYVNGDAQYRFLLQADGKLLWGGGAAIPDVNLYRYNADYLRTDDSFLAADEIYAKHTNARQVGMGGVGPGGEAGLTFGSAGDTNLYRSLADNLKTDDQFTAASNIFSGGFISASDGTANQSTLGYTGAGIGPGLSFGSTLDTNLYRSSADNLKTDDNFQTASGSAIRSDFFDGISSNGPYINTGATELKIVTRNATDAALRLMGQTAHSGNLLTIYNNATVYGSIRGGGNLVLDEADQGAKLFFGSAVDTNLYRSAANLLKTDDTLQVVGDIAVDGANGIATNVVQGRTAGVNIYFDEQGGDPTAPAANRGVLYAKDVGGKTAIYARFNTGAVVQVAIEP